MTREEKMAEAQCLRKTGLTYREIGERLGVHMKTAYRWADPANAEKDREVSRAWKDRNREANRERDNAHSAAPENRGTCQECGGLMGVGQRHDGTCAQCLHDEYDRKARQVVSMWAAGKPIREICAAMGWAVGTLNGNLDRYRADGYDLPYRYRVGKRAGSKFADQVAA